MTEHKLARVTEGTTLPNTRHVHHVQLRKTPIDRDRGSLLTAEQLPRPMLHSIMLVVAAIRHLLGSVNES